MSFNRKKNIIIIISIISTIFYTKEFFFFSENLILIANFFSILSFFFIISQEIIKNFVQTNIKNIINELIIFFYLKQKYLEWLLYYLKFFNHLYIYLLYITLFFQIKMNKLFLEHNILNLFYFENIKSIINKLIIIKNLSNN